jgi:hypothetical protein
MTAEPAVDSSPAAAAGPLDRPPAELRRWSAGTLVGLLWCAALLIGWRRLAGTISIPLQPALLLSVGGLVAIAAAGVRLVWRYLPAQPESSRPDRLISLLATAAVLAVGAALSLRGTSTWGLVAFWAMLVGEELWVWRPVGWRSPPGAPEARLLSRLAGVGAAERPAGCHWRDASATRPPAAVSDGLPGDDVLQQLTRSQAPDGSEQLSGWLRAPFAEGQRTATVHLAFCPQFARTPELTVEQLDGPEILRINQAVFSFGARLDLKLSAPAEGPLGVLLRFAARSKPPAPAASARQSTP